MPKLDSISRRYDTKVLDATEIVRLNPFTVKIDYIKYDIDYFS
jgi:hypothetical protein